MRPDGLYALTAMCHLWITVTQEYCFQVSLICELRMLKLEFRVVYFVQKPESLSFLLSFGRHGRCEEWIFWCNVAIFLLLWYSLCPQHHLHSSSWLSQLPHDLSLESLLQIQQSNIYVTRFTAGWAEILRNVWQVKYISWTKHTDESTFLPSSLVNTKGSDNV